MLAATISGASPATALDCCRLGLAVAATSRRLRSGLPCQRFLRHRRPTTSKSPSDLEEAVRRLREARLFVPHARRCLPASVAAADFLRRLDHEVEIVFAVRTHPFEAYCWIEFDGVVLDDDLDRVRAFTPIAVGLL